MEVLSGCLFHCTYRPHFVYPTVYRHLSISTLALLQIMLLPQSLVYRYLFESLLSILLGIYLAAEFLGHKVILRLTFWDAVIPFSAVTVPFYVPDSSAWRFQFPCFLTNTCELPPTLCWEWAVLDFSSWTSRPAQNRHTNSKNGRSPRQPWVSKRFP